MGSKDGVVEDDSSVAVESRYTDNDIDQCIHENINDRADFGAGAGHFGSGTLLTVSRFWEGGRR
jgi:hypothetical protein